MTSPPTPARRRARLAWTLLAVAALLGIGAAVWLFIEVPAPVESRPRVRPAEDATRDAEPAILGERSDAPDVLLVTIDTLRADHLRLHGAEHGLSSVFTRLGAKGAVFDRAIAASASTAPSHASIMTGLYPRRHSISYINGSSQLEPRFTTLAEIFLEAGYRTGAFVGNQVLKRRIGLDQGFEVYDDELPDREANRRQYFERVAPETVRRARRWLRAQEGPVFLWLHLQDPHGPYTPPDRHLEAVDLPTPEEEEELPVLRTQSGRGGIPAYQALPGVRHPTAYRRRYFGEIGFMNDPLDRLVRAFEARRPSTPKVIVVTSDHGESMGELGYWFAHGHATTPDLVHVPLIVVGPGVEPTEIGATVSHVDVLPTLTDLLDLPPPDEVDGVSLLHPARAEGGESGRSVIADAGAEIGIYDASGYVRMPAPHPGLGRAQRPTPSASVRYAWESGAPTPEEGEEVPVPPIAERYLSPGDATEARAAAAADPELVEMLRSLGYVEPEEPRREEERAE